MGTLQKIDIEIMEGQVQRAKGVLIEKTKVLELLHKRLIEVDRENPFQYLDRIDGILLKELANSISDL